jgi:hypothetical protein
MMATSVSMRRISPNLVNSWIHVPRRGRMATMVVMAELMMETPMKEMDAITLLTRGEAPAVNCE